VSGFNVYEALHECRDLLENYGGHFYAAGMTMLPERVEEFKERFEEVVSRRITDEQQIPEIQIDAELSFADIKPSFYKIMQQFEPFGPGNLKPVFLTKRVFDYRGYSKVVKDVHLRFVVQQFHGEVVEGIGFGLAHYYELLAKGPVDIVYTVDENEFNGNVKLQIKVLDVKASA
jgi:single-stranded-DNA-specific exonuclease